VEIHPKVWGEEHWIVNEAYCGKKLVIEKGASCSLHYHKLKDETFYVLSGLVRMDLGTEQWDEVRTLRPGDSVRVKPWTIHRFTGLEPSEVIEFSTHHEDSDSYRLEPSKAAPRAD
jgi:quercetin dioxygenase-like cupin family protein